MSAGVESEPLALPQDPRVTLRLVRIRDLEGVRTLAERAGIVCDELELARLVRSDPSDRLVLCACAPESDRPGEPGRPREPGEAILGVGVIELGQSATIPSFVLVDAERAAGLSSVIAEALVERARELAASRVA